MKRVIELGKQRAIKLNLDRTFEEKNYPRDVNKIKVGKKDNVAFEPACVFSERKKKKWKFIPRFWSGTRNLILFVDGAKNALKFSKVTEEMMPLWTKKEASEHVKKQIAKARLKFSPITWGKTILIVVLIIIVILIQLYSMSRSPF